MTALNLKLMRDLWHMRGQALAIAVVLAAATATFVLSLGVHQSLIATRDAYYAQNHFGDIFADMTRAPRSIIARVSQIPGVQRAQGSIRQYATIEFPGRVVPVRALINSVDEQGRDRLDRVTLRKGHMPQPGKPDQAVVDEVFATANNLDINSEVDAIIYGSKQRLRIVGIGLAPNYIWAIPPGDLTADESRFGIFWMGTKALEGMTDRTSAINALSLTLERGTSEANVIRAVDRLLEPYGGAGAYGRKDHISHAFLQNELNQLKALTGVIPPVFLLVSAFLVYVVLTRMIGTERTQIGLIKAFGYSDWAIGWHYLGFALAIACVASVLGSVAGIWLGRGITAIYAESFRFPFLSFRIALPVFLAAVGLSFAAAGLGALGGVLNAVRLTPAVAMSPPPPPVYRAGWTERLGTVGGFSPIGHMIVRHIARWPARSAVTVMGIALSTGLLFSMMQFLDASTSMLDTFFFRAQRQDLSVSFTEPRNADVLDELARIPGVVLVEPARGIPVEIIHGNQRTRTAIESGPEDAQLTARIDADGSLVSQPAAGLLLSRHLADKLRVRAGDRVQVDLLGGRRTSGLYPVASIVEEYVGERAYASEVTLLRIAGDAAPVGIAQLRIDPAMRDPIIRELGAMPLVLGVSERAAAMLKFQDIIDRNISTMLFYYIAFASAIAIGVVYNSARILFSERAHELATLRVLGYQSSEVGLVLLGEIALLTIASVPLGCLVGYGLAQLMTAMFSSDLFRLPFAPQRSTYGWAIVVVLLAAIGTAAVVSRRVFRLDMVRVLKARD